MSFARVRLTLPLLTRLPAYADAHTLRGHRETIGEWLQRNLEAMADLQRHTSQEAVIMGASRPQIIWYTGRRTVSFPEHDKFKAVLRDTDWVVVTNFERSQKDYARFLLKKFNRRDVRNGNAAVFAAPRSLTIVIRSSLLIDRL